MTKSNLENKFEQALNDPTERKLKKIANLAIRKADFPAELINSKHFITDLRHVLKKCDGLLNHYMAYSEGRDEAIGGKRTIYNFVKGYGSKD